MVQVLSCVSHVLKSDKEPPVRQAALMVLKNIIRGSSITTIPVSFDVYKASSKCHLAIMYSLIVA